MLNEDILVARPIETRQEFEDYATLRYDTWTEEGYVDPASMPNQARMELDFFDFYAIHVGLFHNQKLVGGGRLIFEEEQNLHNSAEYLSDISANSEDMRLKRRMAPRMLALPFDLIGAFPEFWNQFHQFARANAKIAEVSRIIVSKKLRGRRHSPKIMHRLLSLAFNRGVDRLVLTCAEPMERYYARFGFARCRGIEPAKFGEIDIRSIVMTRNMTGDGANQC